MQNRSCSACGAGFVPLKDRWGCPRCGCVNDGCDTCRDCGWNRSCCQGGVVWTQTQSTRAACSCGAANANSRDKACDDCPASFVTGHRVQSCPDNTRIRRDSDCGCSGETATYQNCGSKNDCGCSGDESRRQGCNRGVGIVHAVEQKLADVFESESALRTGTLFPELHKPLNGRCPACSNCSTCDQQSSFAAWDLRLYLNTHPDDKEALALFRRLCDEAEDPNYATAFLEGKNCGWSWTDDPWPWECQKCGD